ncbi:hypothetical protein WA026_011357 [Henosepilachna vigintioctopunctata]|uniref:RING-type E3 ubiquitin transferase n=1 Tax=Henosepilachna vigintioctopunctata TaxID=420089 RepID=A0AAW1TLF9_9CUCU
MESIQKRRRKFKKNDGIHVFRDDEKNENAPEEDVMKICEFCGISYKPPSRLLNSGDEVCAICFKRRITEPTWISSPSSPVFDIEFDFKLEVKCKYVECDYYSKIDKIQDHQNICENFSPVCLNYPCTWEGKPCNIFDHYKSNHNSYLKMDKPDHKIISISEVKQTYFSTIHVEEIFGRIFLAKLLIDHSNGVVKYTATNMTMFNPEKYKLVVEFKGEERKYIASLNFSHTNNADKEKGYYFIDTNIRFDRVSENFVIHVAKK